MTDCIFCKIANRDIKTHKIYEDKKHVAFLDLYPITKAQCLIIPKKHFGGLDFFNIPDKEYSDLFLFAKKVAKRIKKKLNPKFIFFIVEGTGVDHIHIKLYPIFKVKRLTYKKPMKPGPYIGYISTRMGPRANEKELTEIVEKMKN